MLSGSRVGLERMTESKGVRAGPVASQVNAGNVTMPWHEALIEELQSFSLGQHDDQVDALALRVSQLENDNLAVWLRL